ncbi:MAG: hypothetical protein M3R38_33500 [Actinomycetota bacterium]|nr:hypothetical protein [Actinomycetota bacterium]
MSSASRSGRPARTSRSAPGKYGYVAVTGENAVAVVEMDSLEVETRLDAGEDPMGLIVL